MTWIRYTKECLDAAEGRWPGTGQDWNQTGLIDTQQPKDKRPRPVQIRVAESWFVENVMGKAHPITPIVWFGPFIGYGLYRVVTSPLSVFASIGLFLFGWLFISLVEYSVHRFLFHWRPKTREGLLTLFLLHGYHHEFPNDAMRLVAPPFMSWPFAIVLGPLCWFILGPAGWAQCFAGLCAGYVAYDWIHYYAHHFRPKNPIGKFLRDYHLQHHFDHTPGRYGVSSPLWDLLLGTYIPLKRGKRSSDVAEASS